MRPSTLEARILEMTLAAFGAVACGGAAASSGSGANVPRATEVTSPASPHAAQSSCSAAGCGAPLAKTDTNPQASPAEKPADNVLASTSATNGAPPAPASASPSSDAVAAPSPASVLPAKAKAKPHAKAATKPAQATSKSADDDGCGAGSCGSKKN
jgi:hypothetical protein